MVELAEILRRAGDSYRRLYGDRMPPSHRRAMRDLEACRTPALGGSLFSCDRCDELDFSYHSCRNRHCPKCYRQPTQRWVEKLRHRLLPCPYYLATFTLPAELRAVTRANQRTVYAILIDAAARSQKQLADDPKWIGGTLGILAVLHTWARDLSYHPHVHLLVTAGGLSDDGDAWRKPPRRSFLFPGYVVSPIFRAKVRDALQHNGLLADLDPAIFAKRWTVHLQSAGDGGHSVDYLSRYVHRVALTDHRIERFDGRMVTFRYVSSRTHQTRRLTLPVDKFLGRFLQHVLPRGFPKVRAFGLLSPAASRRRERARQLLAFDQERCVPPAAQCETTTPPDTRRPCPACQQGHLVRRASTHRPIERGTILTAPRPPPT